MERNNQIWETYSESWSNDNSINRIEELRKIMTEDFEYRDPNIALNGCEQLSDYMFQFQEKYKGAYFTITDFQFHNNRSLVNWNMLNAQNQVVSKGTDFAMYKEGKLKQIIGFFK